MIDDAKFYLLIFNIGFVFACGFRFFDAVSSYFSDFVEWLKKKKDR